MKYRPKLIHSISLDALTYYGYVGDCGRGEYFWHNSVPVQYAKKFSRPGFLASAHLTYFCGTLSWLTVVSLLIQSFCSPVSGNLYIRLTSLPAHTILFNMAASNVPVFISIALLVAVTSMIFGLFNKEQPQPYMDEIFHIPQAQNYCVGNLSHWDAKITTLPGLYIVSLMLLRISNFLPFLGSFLDADQPCSVAFLRFVNLMFLLVNFWLLYELSFKINSVVSS